METFDANDLIEQLAEKVHDAWQFGREKQGWTFGPARNDGLKQHPSMRPYGELSESEKELDRASARATVEAIRSLGYEIVKKYDN